MSILLKPDTCRMCKYLIPLPAPVAGQPPEGECHGTPPQIVAFVTPGPKGQPALNVQTIFPHVQLDWSCGAFRAKVQTVQ